MSENNDWKPLQVLKNNFELKEVISPEFIKSFEDEFKDKKIEVINISLFIKNKSEDKLSEKEEKISDIDLISISHKTDKDTKQKRVVIDMNNADSFEKVKKAIEKFNEVS